MNRSEKFIGFLESMATKETSSLIESIKEGFKVCFESVTNNHKVLITYEVVTPEDAEIGEASERGYADGRGNRYDSLTDDEIKYVAIDIEPEADQTIAEATANYLMREGALNFNGSDSYSTDGGQDSDYATYTYHLMNYSPEEIQAVEQVLN